MLRCPLPPKRNLVMQRSLVCVWEGRTGTRKAGNRAVRAEKGTEREKERKGREKKRLARNTLEQRERERKKIERESGGLQRKLSLGSCWVEPSRIICNPTCRLRIY